jgi:hypothetical protein
VCVCVEVACGSCVWLSSGSGSGHLRVCAISGCTTAVAVQVLAWEKAKKKAFILLVLLRTVDCK